MKEIFNSDFHDPSLNERDHSGMNYICNYASIIDFFSSCRKCSAKPRPDLVILGRGRSEPQKKDKRANALGLPPIDSHGSQYGVRGGVQGVQVVPSVRVIQPT